MKVERNKSGAEKAPRRPYNRFQQAAIELLAHRSPKQPLSEIAQLAGVRTGTLARWLRDESFQRALMERCRAETRSLLPLLKNALIKKAMAEGEKECLNAALKICKMLEAESKESAEGPESEALSDEQLLERIRWFRQLYE